MASKNEVLLTFAGDEKDQVRAFDRVGQAAKGMEGDVGKASTGIRDSAGSLDRFGEASDTADTRAMGFRDTLTGVEDTGRGVSMMMKGDMFDGALMLGMGLGDLGSGMFNFIVPAMKAMSVSTLMSAAASAKLTVATAAQTVAQKALNVAMRLNPIGLVITALFAIGAALVLAYNKSETFRKIVQGAFRAVVVAGKALWSGLQAGARVYVAYIKGLATVISAPFRLAFRGIKAAWNATVGGKGFTIPDWVPGLGGKSFRIPRLHQGGTVPGAPGTETLAILQAGEQVIPAGGGGGRVVIELRSDGTSLGDALVEVLARSIRVRGGDVQAVLSGA